MPSVEETLDRMSHLTILFVCAVICSCFSVVVPDNFTNVYRKVHFQNEPKNLPRFLSFNTLDDGDMTVDLEFAVPFISIPVKKTVNAAMGVWDKSQAVANINVGSIFLAGAVIFGAAVFLPFITSLFFKHMFVSPIQRSNEPNETWRIMTLIDQALIENNIDTTSCMQRTMCWLAKNSRSKLNNRNATSQDKIIDGLFTNYWVNQMIEGSAMQTAIQSGLDNDNCALQFKNCKINQNSIQTFAKKFANYLNKE